jgi:hypothetical protein
MLECEEFNQAVLARQPQWIVYRRFGLGTNCGVDECFTLPTLPASFPRASSNTSRKRDGFNGLVGYANGCVTSASCDQAAGETCADPDGDSFSSCYGGSGTNADPYYRQRYSWRAHVYDLELAPSFDFDDHDFTTLEATLTHETSNQAEIF